MLWFSHNLLCFITIILSCYDIFHRFGTAWIPSVGPFPFLRPSLSLSCRCCLLIPEHGMRDYAIAITATHTAVCAMHLSYVCSVYPASVLVELVDSLAYRCLLWTHNSSLATRLASSPITYPTIHSFRIRSVQLERDVLSVVTILNSFPITIYPARVSYLRPSSTSSVFTASTAADLPYLFWL
jgi:hypothetical protein